MKKALIAILLSVASILSINAQESQKIVEQFFKNYQEKGCESAVQIAAATNIWLQKDSEKVNNWGKRLSQMSNGKGDYCGFEVVETNRTGFSLIEYVCLVKHEKAPFKISIIVYKPKDKWQLNNIIGGRNTQKNTPNKQFNKNARNK